MTENYEAQDKCPVLDTLTMISGKWKVPILWNLYQSDMRYTELKRQLEGITNIMLTRSLKDLEGAGLVNRIQLTEVPLHVKYSLTEYSRKLGNALADIKDWKTVSEAHI